MRADVVLVVVVDNYSYLSNTHPTNLLKSFEITTIAKNIKKVFHIVFNETRSWQEAQEETRREQKNEIFGEPFPPSTLISREISFWAPDNNFLVGHGQRL